MLKFPKVLTLVIICIPTEWASVSGWGKTSASKTASLSSKLMAANILTRDHRECSKKFGDNNMIVTKNMLCAGGVRDHCKGDSGGPLTCSKDGQSYLCGIVSWGVDCNDGYYSGTYTDVSKYKQWIQRSLYKIKHY